VVLGASNLEASKKGFRVSSVVAGVRSTSGAVVRCVEVSDAVGKEWESFTVADLRFGVVISMLPRLKEISSLALQWKANIVDIQHMPASLAPTEKQTQAPPRGRDTRGELETVSVTVCP